MLETILISLGVMILFLGVLSGAVFDPIGGTIVMFLAIGIPYAGINHQSNKEIKKFNHEGGKSYNIQLEVSFSDYTKVNSSYYKVSSHLPMKLPFLRLQKEIDMEIPNTRILIKNLDTKEVYEKVLTYKDYTWKNIACSIDRPNYNICFLYENEFYKPYYKEFKSRKALSPSLFFSNLIQFTSPTQTVIGELSNSIPSMKNKILNAKVDQDKTIMNMQIYTKDKIEVYSNELIRSFL